MTYPLLFIAGMLLVNGVPHFVRGVCGGRFQSPFAKPPGKGESSPVVNVLWGFMNLAGAGLLLGDRGPGFSFGLNPGTLVFSLGALSTGIILALHFGRVRKGG
ncbi:MAG TPA: hypothetical protein PLM22_02695 [Candidatus Sabulitectum sp.]|nr:hypothetical protein [Candidatus Sabulitectum sp.]HPJ27814.1 hypothetical protein [Candidatus Sabulitectum sp.]HRW77414.1 hypothetical protein [Candidatus Sabulitectum sp.]